MKEKNRQLEDYNIRLEETEKELREIIDAKNKLFSVVAHDLRSPVGAVIGFSELLYDNIQSLDQQTIEKYAGLISEGALNTYALLENLLFWAQSQMGVLKVNKSEVSILELIRESLYTVSISLDKKNIDFEMDCEEQLTAVADNEMLKVVVRNLLSNAVKFTNPGGKVRVKAFRKKNHTIIEVSDTGVGMNEKMVQEISSSNSITSTPGTAGEKGSGLGLLLCREYTEKNSGSLTVESEPGVGSTFRITLPVKNDSQG